MRLHTLLCSYITLATLSHALPISNNEAPALATRTETADGDDQVVYTWALPDEKAKRTETADGDDQVVYTWALPQDKAKRTETADGDDQVVYTWALPSEEKEKP